MASGKYGYRIIARHGYAIDRLARDMVAEPSHDELIAFLATDTANFIWGFLLATGNNVTVTDKALRNELREVIMATLAKHGIEQSTFSVWPHITAQGDGDSPPSQLVSE